MSDDKLDDFLRFGGAFDWISPSITLVKCYMRQPCVTYAMPVNLHGGPAGMQRLISSWGVECWGADIYRDETILHARMEKAGYIEARLKKEGIPFRGGLAVKSDREIRRAKRRKNRR